ncbi:MAG: gamma-glutamylcyclotransferase [Pikeienuella sp.]
MTNDDLFATMPRLKDRFIPPMESFFRNFDVAKMDQKMKAMGAPADWRHTDEVREDGRRKFLSTIPAGDLWVFAYGSLMWDPAIFVSEIRQATLTGYHRSFCLKSVLGRGTEEFPGLMAGLDTGGSCHGLAMRIEASKVETETKQLWCREMLMHAYRPEVLPINTPKGSINAVAFVIDQTAANYQPNLTDDQTSFMLATGEGELGSSLDYISKLADQFEAIGIHDPDLKQLLARANVAKQNCSIT